MSIHLQIAVFDGFDEIDVFGPYEMLSVPGVEVELATLDEPRTVRSMRGIGVRADAVLKPATGSSFPAAAGATTPSRAPGARSHAATSPPGWSRWPPRCPGSPRSAPEG
jgi:putative intracellular protease/amidase